jgi:hypothetical protein
MRMEFNRYRVMRVLADDCDLCRTCENFGKCPLVRTLSEDLAVLRFETIRIDKCNFHTKRKRA